MEQDFGKRGVILRLVAGEGWGEWGGGLVNRSSVPLPHQDSSLHEKDLQNLAAG